MPNTWVSLSGIIRTYSYAVILASDCFTNQSKLIYEIKPLEPPLTGLFRYQSLEVPTPLNLEFTTPVQYFIVLLLMWMSLNIFLNVNCVCPICYL